MAGVAGHRHWGPGVGARNGRALSGMRAVSQGPGTGDSGWGSWETAARCCSSETGERERRKRKHTEETLEKERRKRKSCCYLIFT
jgi:hypothetical protein